MKPNKKLDRVTLILLISSIVLFIGSYIFLYGIINIPLYLFLRNVAALGIVLIFINVCRDSFKNRSNINKKVQLCLIGCELFSKDSLTECTLFK